MAETEMVERVAKALWDSSEVGDWDSVQPVNQSLYRHAALAAIKVMSEWKPIETARKDGTQYLLYGPWSGEIAGYRNVACRAIGRFTDGISDFVGEGWWELDSHGGYSAWMLPTHYAELPEPPK